MESVRGRWQNLQFCLSITSAPAAEKRIAIALSSNAYPQFMAKRHAIRRRHRLTFDPFDSTENRLQFRLDNEKQASTSSRLNFEKLSRRIRYTTMRALFVWWHLSFLFDFSHNGSEKHTQKHIIERKEKSEKRAMKKNVKNFLLRRTTIMRYSINHWLIVFAETRGGSCVSGGIIDEDNENIQFFILRCAVMLYVEALPIDCVYLTT